MVELPLLNAFQIRIEHKVIVHTHLTTRTTPTTPITVQLTRTTTTILHLNGQGLLSTPREITRIHPIITVTNRMHDIVETKVRSLLAILLQLCHQGGDHDHLDDFPDHLGGGPDLPGAYPGHRGAFQDRQGGYPFHQDDYLALQGDCPDLQDGNPVLPGFSPDLQVLNLGHQNATYRGHPGGVHLGIAGFQINFQLPVDVLVEVQHLIRQEILFGGARLHPKEYNTKVNVAQVLGVSEKESCLLI